MADFVEELRVRVPARLIKFFEQDVPIMVKYHPAGLWPVAAKLLMEDRLKELFSDKEFLENYEIVVMPKAGL